MNALFLFTGISKALALKGTTDTGNDRYPLKVQGSVLRGIISRQVEDNDESIVRTYPAAHQCDMTIWPPTRFHGDVYLNLTGLEEYGTGSW